MNFLEKTAFEKEIDYPFSRWENKRKKAEETRQKNKYMSRVSLIQTNDPIFV